MIIYLSRQLKHDLHKFSITPSLLDVIENDIGFTESTGFPQSPFNFHNKLYIWVVYNTISKGFTGFFTFSTLQRQ